MSGVLVQMGVEGAVALKEPGTKESIRSTQKGKVILLLTRGHWLVLSTSYSERFLQSWLFLAASDRGGCSLILEMEALRSQRHHGIPFEKKTPSFGNLNIYLCLCACRLAGSQVDSRRMSVC